MKKNNATTFSFTKHTLTFELGTIQARETFGKTAANHILKSARRKKKTRSKIKNLNRGFPFRSREGARGI